MTRPRWQPQPHRDSNLDLLRSILHDFSGDPLRCPCLPMVTYGQRDDGELVQHVLHDAIVARVLRAEGGHP